LALFAIINAFVALYYYLNVAKYLYLYRSPDEDKPIPVTRVAQVGLALSSLLILYLGVAPETVYAWSVRAAQAFFLPG
jgi:NADH:ubiquinone oxidoreductase subunit 2 (subunit N)